MKLSMFDLIDETIQELNHHKPTYSYVLKRIYDMLSNHFQQHEHYITIHSRIKGEDSLKEKIIRNKFYINYQSSRDILDNLSDLIGVNIICRFISDEDTIYYQLQGLFDDNGYCKQDENFYVNFKDLQPKLQRNGHLVYRIDGYYMFHGSKINCELQIKSLIRNFYNEIEHQIVYKNYNFVLYNSFIKNVLQSIHENLTIIDNQLKMIFEQIQNENKHNMLGLNNDGIKLFLAQSINHLYTSKSIASLGVSVDFKKSSGFLSQFIYIHDFLSANEPQVKLVEYLERFNLLSIEELDFKETIIYQPFKTNNVFINILLEYFDSVINYDFDWHIFFVMLFVIREQEIENNLIAFAQLLYDLLLQPKWFKTLFVHLPNCIRIEESIIMNIATSLVMCNRIDIIYEENLLAMMDIIKSNVEDLHLKKKIDDEDLEQCNMRIRNSIIKMF
ncbi:hypothetical protein EII25_02380 [Erysipelotrichaceae bacterium OH741_COT-311]|nr:hypothetical protein EII25_02380 [Erysipelotrichaceae bacterium OH741_COT-311]